MEETETGAASDAAETAATPAKKPRAPRKTKSAAAAAPARTARTAASDGPVWEPFSDLGMSDQDRQITHVVGLVLLGATGLTILAAVLAAAS